MKKLFLYSSIVLLLCGCKQKDNNIAFVSTTFGNALHGEITLDFDNAKNLLILKRVGSKYTSPFPPPPPNIKYSPEQKDSIKKEEIKYYSDYFQPTTAVYKITNDEAKKLMTLINAIPEEERKDFLTKSTMRDGFAYNIQIVYDNGKVEDFEVRHQHILSHEKVIFDMFNYC
ncbi:hypothetical protein [Halpernia sp. GG3]